MSFRLVMSVEESVTSGLVRLNKLLPQTMSDLMMSYANQMVDLAQVLCPVRTGFLRSTIHAMLMDLLTVLFGASAPYALWVEAGTSRMASRSFMRPAADSLVPQMVDALTDQITGILGG